MADDVVGRVPLIESKRIRAVVLMPDGRSGPVDLGANVCSVGTARGDRMAAVGVYVLGDGEARLSMVLHPEEARALAQALVEAADRCAEVADAS